MSTDMIEFFKTQGPWALLFVVLFYWVITKSDKREERLIKIVEEQGSNLNKLTTAYEGLTGHVKDLADNLERRKSQ